jgi:hypothetical protein
LNAHGGGSCVFALQFPQRLFPPLSLPLPLRPPLFSSPHSSFVLVLLLKQLVMLLLPQLCPKLALPLSLQLFSSLHPFFVFLRLMQAVTVKPAFALLLLVKMVVPRGSRQRRRRLQLLLLLLLLLLVTTLVVEVELVLLLLPGSAREMARSPDPRQTFLRGSLR